MSTLILSAPQQKKALLRHQLNRLLNDVGTNPKAADMTWTPAMEMLTTSTAVILRLELPGVKGKDLDLQVTRTAVLIAGDRPTNPTEGRWPSEIRYGKFRRLITLPVPVDNTQVQTEFNNGILTLTLPKLAAVRPEVVKVKVSSASSTRETEVAPAAVTEPDELKTDLWAA
ncbi:MAG: Hsp20/alpha crystallin family protein [Hormoscilla sp. GM7CHS1pb]|nr:Hsp20/alpha crystallin family protein [Hormoscilla sp. GM7CHS1pb]